MRDEGYAQGSHTSKMLRLITVLCLTTACIGNPTTRDVPRLDGLIVGGSDADIADLPWQLGLQQSGSHICGASVISADWAITAAHCTGRILPPSVFSLRANSSIWYTGGIVYDVAQRIVHSMYSSNTLDYDFSLLRVSTPFVFGVGVAVIALPALNQFTPTGAVTTISGWGALWSDGPYPDQLQVVQLPVVSIEDCRAYYGDADVTDRMICAGVAAGGLDSCQGDSGGPMVYAAELIGLVSWGVGCALPDTPGVYSKVSSVRDWIETNTGV